MGDLLIFIPVAAVNETNGRITCGYQLIDGLFGNCLEVRLYRIEVMRVWIGINEDSVGC